MAPFASRMSEKVSKAIENSPKNLAIARGENSFDINFGHLLSDLAERGVVSSDSYQSAKEDFSKIFQISLEGIESLEEGDLLPAFLKDAYVYRAEKYVQKTTDEEILEMGHTWAVDVAGLLEDREGRATVGKMKHAEDKKLAALRRQQCASGSTDFLSWEVCEHTNKRQKLDEAQWAVSADQLLLLSDSISSHMLFNHEVLNPKYRGFSLGIHDCILTNIECAVFDGFEYDEDSPEMRQKLKGYYFADFEVFDLIALAALDGMRSTTAYKDLIKSKLTPIIESLCVTKDDKARFLGKYPLMQTVEIADLKQS